MTPPSPGSPLGPNAVGPHRIASLRRRFACFVYEGVLLFGVVMVTGLVYAGVFQQRHALHGRHGLQATLFAVLAAYFVWFWSHGGQTVAMRAWSVRVLTVAGDALTLPRALARFLLAWSWFLPALIVAASLHVATSAGMFALLGAGIVGYAAFVAQNPQRQFLHDVICGTCLIRVEGGGSAEADAIGPQAAGTSQNDR